MKIGSIFLVILIQACNVSPASKWENQGNLSDRQIERLVAFANLYGCARYFYPNQSVNDFSEKDWYSFLAYGIERIVSVQDEIQFKDEMLHVFRPIIPELTFEAPILNTHDVNLKSKRNYYAWEHYGFGTRPIENIFKSEIKTFSTESNRIIIPDSLYEVCLSESLFAYYPIGVTYKHKRTKELNNLLKNIRKRELRLFPISEFSYVVRDIIGKPYEVKEIEFLKSSSVRIADLILKWSIIRHFYPYFEEDDLDQTWEKALITAIQSSNQCGNQFEYYDVVRGMLSNVHDSHIGVNLFANLTNLVGLRVPYFMSDMKLGWVDESIYIEMVPEQLQTVLSKGDVLEEINGIPIDTVVSRKGKLISASTKQGMYEALVNGVLLESFKYNDTLELRFVNRGNDTVAVSTFANKAFVMRDNNQYPYFIKEIAPGVYHVNLVNRSAESTYQEFVNKIDLLKEAKGVILDVRGYPDYQVADSILAHFLADSVRYGDFRRPTRYFPQQKDVVYEMNNDYLYPAKERLRVPLCVLINHQAMSYAETFIHIIKENRVGTLIGLPTNGTNGDVAMIKNPIYGFSMTMIKDFSPNHGKGICPDIIVFPTLETIRQNHDTILAAAKEYIYELDTVLLNYKFK